MVKLDAWLKKVLPEKLNQDYLLDVIYNLEFFRDKGEIIHNGKIVGDLYFKMIKKFLVVEIYGEDEAYLGNISKRLK